MGHEDVLGLDLAGEWTSTPFGATRRDRHGTVSWMILRARPQAVTVNHSIYGNIQRR